MGRDDGYVSSSSPGGTPMAKSAVSDCILLLLVPSLRCIQRRDAIVVFCIGNASQNALQLISSWMIANLLTLDSSKTEFLLIRLKRQLAKYTTVYLTPPTLLEISASSLTNILPSLIKLHLSPESKACYYLYVTLM